MAMAVRTLTGAKLLLAVILFLTGTLLLQMTGIQNPSYAASMDASIPMEINGHGIAINQNTDELYATAGNSVYIIDAATDRVVSNFTLGISPQNVVVNGETNRVFIAHKVNVDRPGYSAESKVSVLDGTTKIVLTSFNMKSIVDIDESRNVAYMTNDSATIYAVNGQTYQIESSVTLESPSLVKIDPVHQKIYAAIHSENDTVSVSIFDSLNYKPIGEVIDTGAPIGSIPMGLAINPETGRIYVGIQNGTDSGDNSSGAPAPAGFIAVIDGSTNKMIDSIRVASFGDVQINPITNRIYAANAPSGSIFIIDGNTNKLIDTVSGLNFPTAIAVSPKFNKVFVINHSSDFISVIHDSNLVSKPVSFSLSSEMDGTEYRINGLAKNVTVQSFDIFPGKEIAFALDPQPHIGTLELLLPKNLIDGITVVNPTSSDYTTSIEYEILTSNSTHTTLKFDVPEFTRQIEIQATTVVPEFAGIGFIVVISASITATIMLSRIIARKQYLG